MAIEIERKFLLKYNPCNFSFKRSKILQGYLKKDKETVIRVRIADDQGFLTVKGETKNSARLEFEYPIPEDDALFMIEKLCHRPVIEKTRYFINYNGMEWVVDEFFKENKGLLLAEVELENQDQLFEEPDWIGKEVTNDPKYYNSNLVENPFSEWK